MKSSLTVPPLVEAECVVQSNDSYFLVSSTVTETHKMLYEYTVYYINSLILSFFQVSIHSEILNTSTFRPVSSAGTFEWMQSFFYEQMKANLFVHQLIYFVL